MDKKLFNELVAGIKEMKAVQRGATRPVRVTQVDPESPAAVRQRMGLSQEQFATLLGISVRTLQNWDQGHRAPTGAARVLLRVAARHPKLVLKAATAQSCSGARRFLLRRPAGRKHTGHAAFGGHKPQREVSK